MAKGLNVKSPLIIDSVDGPYALIKDARNAIKQNLKAIILTSPGERIWNPLFGVGVKRYLFEQLTDVVSFQISQRIQDQVRLYAPYVRDLKITVEKASDLVSDTNYKENNANTILVSLSYNVETSKVFFEDFFNLEVTP
jgi:phage baseplate assembly protein W